MNSRRHRPDDYWSRYLHRPNRDLRQMDRKTSQRANACFYAVLFLFTFLSLIIPLRPTYSDLEQRNLTPFPKVSAAGLMSGEFFDGMNTWFADTFPFREPLLKLESKITSLYGVQTTTVVGDVEQGDEIPDTPMSEDSSEESGTSGADNSGATSAADKSGNADNKDTSSGDKSGAASTASTPQEEEKPVSDKDIPELSKDAKVEKLGAVLVIDDAAYEYYNFDKKCGDSYIKLVNNAAAKLKGKARVFNLVIPTSMDICVPESVRKSINSSSQQKALKYLHDSMSDNVYKVDVFDTLLRHSLDGEYLYFRTDHHWTADGAYHAYEEFCKSAGLQPTPLDSFQKKTFKGFQGSFYRDTKSPVLGKNPDTVFAYVPPSTNKISITDSKNKTWDWEVVTDVSKWNASSKYNAFIGGDNPISHIENPKKTDGSSILVIKESFGNCFAPFLVENFQHVYVLDYRYFRDIDTRKLDQLAADLKLTDVLFLNNVSAVRNENAVKMMAHLVG